MTEVPNAVEQKRQARSEANDRFIGGIVFVLIGAFMIAFSWWGAHSLIQMVSDQATLSAIQASTPAGATLPASVPGIPDRRFLGDGLLGEFFPTVAAIIGTCSFSVGCFLLKKQ